MPPQDDREYLERRRRLSEEKARSAPDPGIARIHGEFAAAYARRLAQSSQQQVPLAE